LFQVTRAASLAMKRSKSVDLRVIGSGTLPTETLLDRRRKFRWEALNEIHCTNKNPPEMAGFPSSMREPSGRLF
jgi:hypothetical protein